MRTDKDVAHKANGLALLKAVAEHLNRFLDLDSMLKAVLPLVLDLTGLSAGWVLLREEDGRFALAAAHGLPPGLEDKGGAALQWPGCRCQRLLAAGELRESMAVLPCERLERFYQSLEGKPLAAVQRLTGGLVAHATVPLRAGEEVLGVLNVALPEGHLLSDEVLHLLTLIGEMVGTAVHRAQVYGRLRRQAAELEDAHSLLRALVEIAAQAGSSPDPDTVLERIGAQLQKLGLTCAVGLVDPDDGSLVLRYTNLLKPVQERLARLTGILPRAFRIPRDRYWRPDLFEQGQSVIDRDPFSVVSRSFSHLPPAVQRRIAAALGFAAQTSILNLPLRVEDRVIGVLSLWGREWREEDIPIFSAFANQVAATLHMARLYEQLRASRAREQETLLELAGLTEPETALQVAVTFIGRALEAEYVALWTPDTTGRYLVMQAGAGWSAKERQACRLEVDQTPEGHAYQAGEPVQVAGDSPSWPTAFRQSGIVRGVLVPVPGDPHPLGVLGVYTAGLREFTPDDVRLIILTATQVSLVIRRSQAYQALQASEARYRSLFHGVPVGLFRLAPDGRFLEANQVLLEQLGYAELEALRASRIQELLANAKAGHQVQKLIAGELRTLGIEAPVRRADGSTLWARLTLRAVQGAAGQIHHIEGSLEDITERRWAEQRYRRLFEEAPVMYIITRNEGGVPIIEDCNRAFLETLGYKREEVIGRPLADFYTPESRRALLEGGGYARALTSAFTAEERQLVTREGHVIETILYAAPEVDTAGNVTGTRAAFVDITPLRQAERALRRERDRLAALEHILTALLDPALELDDLLNLIVQETTTLLGVEIGGAYIVEHKHVVLRAWQGISDTFRARASSFPVGSAPVWLRDPLVARQETEIPPDAKADGIRVWASIPLRLPAPAGEEPVWVGTLIAASCRPDALDEADLYALNLMATQMALSVDHHRTFHQAKERLNRLRTLHEIDRTILQHRELEPMFRSLLGHILHHLEADVVGLSLLEPGYQQTLFVTRLPGGTLVYEHAANVIASVTSQLIERQEPVFIPDLTRNPQIRAHRNAFHKWRLASYLGAPLVIRGRVVGILHIFTTRPRSLTDEELEFLRTLAGQAAIAFENAKTFIEVSQRAEAVGSMLAAHAATVNISPDETISAMLRAMCRALGNGQGAFFRLEEHNQTLVLDAAVDLSPEMVQHPQFAVGEEMGLVGLVALTRRPVYLPQGEEDPHWTAVFPTAKSAYLVPVQRGDHLFGVAVLMAPTPDAFPEAARSLIDLFAHFAGAVLQNAHLFAETRRRAEHLAALHTIVAAGAGATELPSLLETVLYRLQNALKIPAGAIWAGGHAIIRGIPSEISAAIRQSTPTLRLDISRPVAVPDWEALSDESPQAALKPLMQRYGIRASLTAPLVHRDQLVGGISLVSPLPRVWSADEVALVEAVGQELGSAVERLRLFQEARERAERLEVLATLNQTLNRTLTEQQVIQAIGRGALTLSDADWAAVFLREDTGFVRVWSARASENVELSTTSLLDLFNRPDREYREPILVSDIADWPPNSPLRQALETRRMSAVGLWPLVYADRIVGLLVCAYKAPHKWSDAEQDVLRTFVHQAVLVLMNTRHFQAEQTRRQELAGLYSLSRHLVATDQPEEIANTIVQAALSLVGVTVCLLFTAGEKDTWVYQAAAAVKWYRFPEDRTEIIRFPLPEHALAESPLLVLSRDDPDFHAVTGALGLDMVNQLCLVPLKVGEETVGLLLLGEARNAAREPFDADKQRLVLSFADQAASALHRAHLHTELEDAYLQTALALAKAMDARDTYTADHSERMAEWAVAVARELGLDAETVEAVRLGALLHDIGKIGVPDSILRKPGRLTEEEWAIIKKHPEIGAEIISPVKKLAPVVPIVRSHQERWDGKGYPDGLKGEEIPVGARILAVVDAYSAITDERPYKPARTHEEAVEELRRCAGTQFDPQVVEAFLKVLKRTRAGD